MELTRSIVAEIRAHDAALVREIVDWQQLAEDRPEFKLHRSQIARICRTVGCAQRSLELHETDERPARELLRSLQERRQRLQALHLVWNFFRHKLMQRMRPEFQEYLTAADDLAWACYQPFLQRIADDRDSFKEPPLTFLSLGPAPFAQARVSSFSPPGLSSRRQRKLYSTLKKLPVPIIGLPWHQVGHMADLVQLGHETAHIVVGDLRLIGELKAAVSGLQAIPEERRGHWASWLDEAFADVFGVQACGAGYGYSLIRALADDVGVIRNEAPEPTGAYPQRHVRVALLRVTAARLGLDCGFADHWAAAYGAGSSAYLDDVEPLVEAFLTHRFTRLGGALLGELLPPPRTDEVERYAEALLYQDSFGRAASSIRALIAGAAVAQARGSGQASHDGESDRRLARFINDNRQDGYRDETVDDLRMSRLGTENRSILDDHLRREDDTMGQEIASLLMDDDTDTGLP